MELQRGYVFLAVVFCTLVGVKFIRRSSDILEELAALLENPQPLLAHRAFILDNQVHILENLTYISRFVLDIRTNFMILETRSTYRR